MRKVVLFNRMQNKWLGGIDIDLLNSQIQEMENDGWSVISVTANTNFMGGVSSYTILIESPK